MPANVIRRRPRLSPAILIVGLAIYWLLCLPLHGRRGFPELPPIYLAMIWMWVPPVILAAVFDDRARRRLKWLIGYGLVAGFLVAAGTVTVVPNHQTYSDAAVEALVFFGPLMILLVVALDWLTRQALRLVRRFPPEPTCQGCGYPLHHLPEPRCPECGHACDPAVIDPAYEPRLTRGPWRVWAFMVLMFVAVVTFPFVYHTLRELQVLREGRAWAEAQWEQGDAYWPVPRDVIDRMDDDQVYSLLDLDQVEPVSGLRLRSQRSDWWGERRDKAYRQRIAELLEGAGRQPPPLNIDEQASRVE